MIVIFTFFYQLVYRDDDASTLLSWEYTLNAYDLISMQFLYFLSTSFFAQAGTLCSNSVITSRHKYLVYHKYRMATAKLIQHLSETELESLSMNSIKESTDTASSDNETQSVSADDGSAGEKKKGKI